MKNILIQTKNDRGSEVRVSTRKGQLDLKVYYLDSQKKVRSQTINLFANGDKLAIHCCGMNVAEVHGNPGQKLDFCK